MQVVFSRLVLLPILTFIFVFAAWPPVVFAQSDFVSHTPIIPVIEDQDFEKIRWSGQLKVQSTNYLTEFEKQPELNRSYHYLFELSAQKEFSWLSFDSEFVAGHYSEINNSYMVIPNLNLNVFGGIANSRIMLGRKTKKWSVLDETWKFSFWQPSFKTDPLEPIQQGLTGIDWIYETPSFHFSFFYSSFFMPNMGGKILAQNGNLEIQNRWIMTPRGEFPLRGKSTQILYSLDSPSIQKIIHQQTVAWQTSWGDPTEGLNLKLAWANKPVNELVLGYKGLLRLNEQGTYGDVTLVPEVVSHKIKSVDASYRGEIGGLNFSILEDEPKNIQINEGWNWQQLENFKAWSIRLDLPLEIHRFLNGELSVARLRVQGGRIFEMDSEGNSGSTLDGLRVPFTDAWAVEYSGSIWNSYTRNLYSNFRWVRDLEEKGSLLNVEFDWNMYRYFHIFMGADIIGVADSSDMNYSKSFLNQFRANDRWYSGVSYVF